MPGSRRAKEHGPVCDLLINILQTGPTKAGCAPQPARGGLLEEPIGFLCQLPQLASDSAFSLGSRQASIRLHCVANLQDSVMDGIRRLPAIWPREAVHAQY